MPGHPLSRRRFIATTGGVAAGYLVAPAPVHGAGLTEKSRSARADHRSIVPAVQTEALARHAVQATFDDLDARTLDAVKLRVLDVIGCVIAGARAGGNRALAEIVAAADGKPEASLIGFRAKGTVADVAMVNAILARSYDFEVMTAVIGSKAVPSHHSPTTCMTALALAERNRSSGHDFLIALAVGDDIAARLLVASGLDFDQGWDGSPVYSALAAVAIAARFRGLTPRQTQDAMGIAVDQIGGTIQNIWDGATDFKLPQGAVARNAILSVELAARGWTGMEDVLHAPFGFYAQYTAGCADPEVITRELGRVFHGEAYFKPYPACMAVHPSIDCALELRRKHAMDTAAIERVTVQLPKRLLDNFCAKPFEARRFAQADANFSFQFLVANALLRGSILQEHYEESAIRSPEMAAMVRKVALGELESGAEGVLIEVRTRDGRVLRQAHGPLADRHPFVRPATRDDIVAKFRQQIAFGGYVPIKRADEILRRIEHLEEEADMSRFVALLTRSTLEMG